jgi:site-specific DNA-adenine methylase|tara:strand:+ start:674 stop:1441 length:768 start_codon:yes stop_codon:yes gene_type:complete
VKSPIKDSTNQFKCATFLKKLIPEGSVVHSFLFYAGDLEFTLAESQRFVYAHTIKPLIHEFWECALEDAERLHAIVTSPVFTFESENMFPILQETWPTYRDPYLRSSLFFLLNRCSSSGLISSGELNDKNFNPIALSYLKKFNPPNFHVVFDKEKEFVNTLPNADGDYLLIPVGKFNYNLFDYGKSRGHETTIVNHKALAATLKEMDKDQKWIVVYNFHAELLKLYEDYKIVGLDKYGNVKNNPKEWEELVIANF